MSYDYTAYGLNFSSTLPLPEFRKNAAAPPDITISYGEVPENLQSPSDYGIAWQAEEDKLLLTVEQVARYLITGNNRVVIEPLPQSREANVRAFLLGSVLGALLHGRQIFVLHASVVQTDSGAVLFMGNSGAGKSTLLGAFLKRGYAMLSDDKAGITLNDQERIQILPGFPRVRLTAKAVEKLRFPVQGADFNGELDKYIVPIEKFCSEPLPIKAAYALAVHNRPEIVIEPLPVIEQFETLNYHTYRRRFILRQAQRETHFRILKALTSEIAVKRVVRPIHPFLIEELVERVEEDLAR